MQHQVKTLSFRKGLIDGLPICLGYLSVSFGIGILAVRAGMTVLQAVLLSLTNLTSAGQAAGIGIIGAGGGMFELALSQFVINLRYSLMGISLSQKLAPGFGTPQRLLTSFGITDEVFGVSSAQEEKLIPTYMYGMILISTIGWTLGTLLGAVAGEILPPNVSAALGMMLYGMFLAILIPAARKDLKILPVLLVSIGCSVCMHYLFPQISGGFAVILSAVASAVVGALFFPVKEEVEA